ncbi:Holliday junction resolvase RuvX [Candidatus Profftella armatura]|nr:Holliday junction resolvase RuvX [Candidatus Profftella armatura]
MSNNLIKSFPNIEIIFGFDFGFKRIGIAFGNTLIKHAKPLKIIHSITNKAKFNEISKLVEKWKPKYFVVGFPTYIDMTSEKHKVAIRCKRFANQLYGRYSIKTFMINENYSSIIIKNYRKKYIDSQSAALILQQYFNEKL